MTLKSSLNLNLNLYKQLIVERSILLARLERVDSELKRGTKFLLLHPEIANFREPIIH